MERFKFLEGYEKGVFTLSVSKSKTFKECKAKYRFNYILKLPQKDREYLTLGKVIHLILEKFHKAIIEGNDEPYHILMSKCFKEAIAEWNAPPKPGKKQNPKITVEQLKECKGFLTEYLALMAEQKKQGTLPTVIKVEEPFFLLIDDTVLLNGFIDRVEYVSDKILEVADYKSTKSKSSLKKDFFQLQTYAFIMFLKHPELELVRTSYILLRHGFERFTKEFTREEAMKTADEFLSYTAEINAEKLWRPTTSNLCRTCDFLDHCKEGRALFKMSEKKEFGKEGW